MSREYSFCIRCSQLIINLSNSSGIARYSLLMSMCKCANICLCSVAKLTGSTFHASGLGPCLLLSHFRDSLNATFIKLTKALLAPSIQNQVFQCFLYRLKTEVNNILRVRFQISFAENPNLRSSFKNSVKTTAVYDLDLSTSEFLR